MHTSFLHLGDYGAKYYSYVLTRIIAFDIFEEIKLKNGLLDCNIGSHLKDSILSHGGSQDPKILINNFLKRPSNSYAFCKNWGFI